LLRDARSTCERAIGSPADIAKLTGLTGKLGFRYSHNDRCSATFMSDDDRTTLVDISLDSARYASEVDRSRFVDVKSISVGGKSATLYLAGDAREKSTDELLADAQSRVGRSADPIGDALVAGPETKHTVVVPLGDNVLRVRLDRRVSAEQAQAYVSSVVNHM
jgi:hypothetical protein